MKIYSVESINHYIRDMINSEFKYPLAIKGEMSDLKKSYAGHHYFTLSSNDASVSCAFFINKNIKNLDLASLDQEEVLVIGTVDFYVTKGRFQIIVEDVDIYGEGALKKSIEKTRLKLESEGIFKNNRQISKYPKKVGVITSPKSDAFKDVCSKFNERYPLLEIYLYPVSVQGKNAPHELMNQITKCNNDDYVDVIMLVRGGGSLEDLMPFNDESLAMCIFESKIPIVTGIGHQPDITIADYAADKATETPTAAAVYISPNQNEILQNIDNMAESINTYILTSLENKKNVIKFIKPSLERINPSKIITLNRNLYHTLYDRLHKMIKLKNDTLKNNLNSCISRFEISKQNISNNYIQAKKEYINIYTLFKNISINLIKNKKSLIKRLNLEIKSCNPKNMLKKGYSIISDKKGKLLKTTKTVNSANEIVIELQDGKVEIGKNNSKKLLD